MQYQPTPSLKWKISIDGFVKSCLSINNIFLYWAEGLGLFAISEYDGEKIWKFNTKSKLQMYHGITSDSYSVFCIDNDCNIYSLDIKKGDLNWSLNVENIYKLEDIRTAGLLYSNELLFVYSSNGTLTAIDVKTGKVSWSKSNYYSYNLRPCIFGNYILYQGTKEFIYAYNMFDGSKVWEYRVEENDVHQYKGIDSGNDYVFITGPYDTIDDSNYLYAIRPNTGKLAWKSISGGFTSHIQTYDDLLFCWHRDETLCAIEQNSGLIKWKNNNITNSSSNPIIHRNLLLLGAHSDYLTAINPVSGEEIWKHEIPSSNTNNNNFNNIMTITSTKNNLIIVGTLDGYVYALEF